jgi:hypothetical protein
LVKEERSRNSAPRISLAGSVGTDRDQIVTFNMPQAAFGFGKLNDLEMVIRAKVGNNRRETIRIVIQRLRTAGFGRFD